MKKLFYLIFLSLLLPLFMFSSVLRSPRKKLRKNSPLNIKVKNRKQLAPSNKLTLSTKNNTKENQNKIKTVSSSIKKPETKNYQSTNKQITELTDKIKFLEGEIIKLKTDLAEKEQKLKTVQSGLGNQTTLQAELDQAKKDLELKEKEFIKQKEAFDKKELAEQTLQIELKTKTDELDKLLKSSDVSQSLQEENQKLIKKNGQLETKIKEIEQLKTKIKTLKTEKENIEKTITAEVKKANQVAKDNVAEVTKKMEEVIEKKDKELKEAKEKLSGEYKKIYEEKYKQEILKLEKTIESLTGQLSGENNTAQRKFEENTKANETRINELNKKIEPLEKENKELNTKIKELEENKKVSQETEQALKKEKEALELKIKELEKNIETLQSKETLDKKISELNKELASKNQTLEKTNTELTKDNDSKNKEINLLKNKEKESSLWTAEKINNLRVAIEEEDTNQSTFKDYQKNKNQINKAIKNLSKALGCLE